MSEIDKIITTEEAAKLMNCSVRFLKELRANKDGPMFIKLGRLIRYRVRDILMYLDKKTVRTA